MAAALDPNEQYELLNRYGAITMITPVRWFGVPVLRLLMKLTALYPPLIRLAPPKAVAFTRWSILRTIPYNGRPQIPERPRPTYLMWETVFNGVMDPYIEQFVVTIPDLIRNTWFASYGFPRRGGVPELREYIETLSWPSGHTYVAYPEWTIAEILSAAEIAKEHHFLVDAAEGRDPADFAVVYEGFLRRRWKDL